MYGKKYSQNLQQRKTPIIEGIVKMPAIGQKRRLSPGYSSKDGTESVEDRKPSHKTQYRHHFGR